MIYIKNDEAAYLHWLEVNPSGFVVNMHTLGKDRSLLHRARCSHLYPPNTSKVHTVTYPKVCANDLDEVRLWVISAGSEVELCTTCMG
ncbi:MAG: hypothetical protein QM692_08220 [Thermomicrobiales bacterium]